MTNDTFRLTQPTDPLLSLVYRGTKRLAQAFLIFCLCGTVGVLIDLDHIPRMLSLFLPQVYGHLVGIGGRFNHQFVFRGLFVVLFALCAYGIGRVAQLIRLTRRK